MRDPASSSDEQLLASRETQAFGVFYDRHGPGTLVRAQDGRVVRRLPAPAAALPVMAVTGGDAWVVTPSARGGFRLQQLDGASGRVRASIGIGTHRPVALVAAGDRLCAVGADGAIVVVAR